MDLNMSTLSYSTYLGGGSNDEARALAADNLGNAYVAGETNSEDFPVTPGAFDTSFVYDKAYVAKLNSSGASLGYCTFLGGSSDDEARGIAVDDSGYAYVAGSTDSPDFPTSEGAFDTTYCDSLFDAFLTRLGPSGRTLAYSTYLGGQSADVGCAVALGGPRLVYVAGETESQDFPVTGFSTDKTYSGFVDVFVTRLDLPAVPATAAGEVGLRPERYALYRNYPNPFNPTTRISFSLPKAGPIEISVHDISGRLVRTLSNDYRHAGEFSIYWNGRDDSGGEVSSGVYFIRLKAGDFEATRKVTLLK
jgi:hypothetical protein